MPRPAPVAQTSFEEYLELEAKSQVRHEFVDGMLFAMAGGTDYPATISLNIATQIRAAARASGCFAYMENMLVRNSITTAKSPPY